MKRASKPSLFDRSDNPSNSSKKTYDSQWKSLLIYASYNMNTKSFRNYRTHFFLYFSEENRKYREIIGYFSAKPTSVSLVRSY
jgi:hypothetical protein